MAQPQTGRITVQRLLKTLLRIFAKPTLSGGVPLKIQRTGADLMAATFRGPRNVQYQTETLAGVSTLKITPDNAEPGRTLLYLHGGGFVLGSFRSHQKLAAAIGQAAKASVWMPDYGLAPERPHPAATQDALAVYQQLLANGQDPSRLHLSGDSAGAGLAVALAVAIRKAELPMPASMPLISPFVDLSLSGSSINTHRKRDPLLNPSWLQLGSDLYRQQTDAKDPSVSPLFADLSGLPPMLIQVGSEEILLSDSERLHVAAQNHGLDCRYHQFDGLWHDFHMQYGLLKQANQAINEMGAFMLEQETSNQAA